MGLIEDFATWTEKLRRQLTRESGDAGRKLAESLPEGVPIGVPEALDFIEALLDACPPEDVVSKATKWKEKLTRI